MPGLSSRGNFQSRIIVGPQTREEWGQGKETVGLRSLGLRLWTMGNNVRAHEIVGPKVTRDLEGMAVYRNNAGETWKNSASLRMCALLGSRFPLMTSDATLRDPKTGNRSACFRARAP